MVSKDLNSGVQLPSLPGSRPSASNLMYEILQEAITHFSSVFPHIKAPKNPSLFKKGYADFVMNFEAARGASTQRAEVARFITDRIQESFLFVSPKEILTLEQAFLRKGKPLPLVCENPGQATPGFKIGVEYKGRHYGKRNELLNLLIELEGKKLMSKEASTALAWAVNFAFSKDPPAFLNLGGKKFAFLGGTAELSPISALLTAGADVLTTHSSINQLKTKIKSELQERANRYPGRLFTVEDGVNLLTSPVEFAETIIQFADGKKVTLGVFAYKGGQGREWRLAAAMDAIVRKVKSAGVLASVIYYLSPSITTELSLSTARVSSERFDKEYGTSKKLLNLLTFNNLLKPNLLEVDGKFWSRSILPYQGASYAAANLFGKIYPAELCSGDVTVSANVAPITMTTSTDTAEAQAAFPYAKKFGVEVFEPTTTRTLMFLLTVYDLLNPDLSSTGNLFAKQIHGGVFTSPWALDTVMKLAYFRGVMRRLL